MSLPTTQYWLMKSEPDVYSIDAFQRDGESTWTGVRNYQARNYMMGEEHTKSLPNPVPGMRVGDEFLFYHSNAEPPAVVGIGRIVKLRVVDPDQFKDKSDGFDPKATKAKPIWFCAKVAYVRHLERPVTLDELRAEKSLSSMLLLQRGSRLSIQPVAPADFTTILKMAKIK